MQVVAWRKTPVSFSLLRSSMTALRGCHTEKTGYISLPAAELVVNECRLHWIFFISSLQEKKKGSHETHYIRTSFMYTSHFFIQLVWFSSVSHTSTNLLLSTESFPFVCESLSNYYAKLIIPSFRQDPPPLIWVFGHFWLFCTMV